MSDVPIDGLTTRTFQDASEASTFVAGCHESVVRMALCIAGASGTERAGQCVAEHGVRGAMTRWLTDGQSDSRKMLAALNRVRDAVAATAACGSRFIVPGSDEWPTAIDDLDVLAPAGLWVRGTGNLASLTESQIAIVGSRSASAYGERIASSMASHAAGRGISVVSGGANGIDAAAHRGAIAAGGSTVVVLACGVDVAYPAGNAGLFERAAQGGCIISEVPPQSQVRKHLFLTRNRLIAALGASTVVVEAAWRSGALNTANWAASLGREVWGVPGSMLSAASAGVHRGIYEGGIRLARDFDDPIALLATDSPPVAEGARELADLLREAPLTTDQICARMSHASVNDVLASLSMLELGGLVMRVAGGWMAKG